MFTEMIRRVQYSSLSRAGRTSYKKMVSHGENLDDLLCKKSEYSTPLCNRFHILHCVRAAIRDGKIKALDQLPWRAKF
jgi:hypothetical protein